MFLSYDGSDENGMHEGLWLQARMYVSLQSRWFPHVGKHRDALSRDAQGVATTRPNDAA